MADPILYAHLSHYLWTLYLPPIAVVVFAIVKTTISERRAERREREGGERS